jgi:polar amino acid transport system permease protein
MSVGEICNQLFTWTPFLLSGFGMNIIIALVAMAVGTGVGGVLASMRVSPNARSVRYSLLITEFSRSIPTIVFQFYLAFMLPSEVPIPSMNLILTFPIWLKAALALAIAVVGFTSDNLSIAMEEWRKGNHNAAFLFIPSWTRYAVIVVMASSTASLLGIGELISRCNTVINAIGDTRLMLPVYLYACLIFFGFCYPLTMLMKYVSRALKMRLQS